VLKVTCPCAGCKTSDSNQQIGDDLALVGNDAVKVPQENYENEHDEPSEFDDDICVNESDEEHAAEVQEFNN
jgi:hypothetical protein